METVFVIGSGPAGIACSLGLLSRNNVKVVMLDVGRELETSAIDRRHTLNKAISYPDSLPPWEQPSSNKFVKHVFGSTYAYALDGTANKIQMKNAMLRASYAKGGLSNVWGASIMPYRKEDISDWPSALSNTLDSYYKEILSFLPLTSTCQEEFQQWPLLHDQPMKYSFSAQAALAFKNYSKNKTKLNNRGIFAGGARLALHQDFCMACRECMHGCTQDAVYSTRHTLDKLIKNPLFTYRPGIRVEKVAEDGTDVNIAATEINTNLPIKFKGKKVFIAAGSLLTPYLLMRSLPQLNNVELIIKDSQHFTLPALLFRRDKNARSKISHALSQMYYEILQPNLSIHLQLYTYMELFEDEFNHKFKSIPLARYFKNIFLDRLMVFQGYLSSALSGKMHLRLEGDQLLVTGESSVATAPFLKRLNIFMTKQAFVLGFLPLTIKASRIGEGNHCGGSFPMTVEPKKSFETDLLGRLIGLKHIHIVDASVLPSLAAQSITLTSMANAFRIGAEYTL